MPRTMTCTIFSVSIAQSPRKFVQERPVELSIRSTMFDRMKGRAMMSFRPVFINEPSDADTKHSVARALLLQRFPPVLSRG